jgi:hypothetical protein
MDPEKDLNEDDLIALCPEHHRQAHNARGGVTIVQVRDWATRENALVNPDRRLRRRRRLR